MVTVSRRILNLILILALILPCFLCAETDISYAVESYTVSKNVKQSIESYDNIKNGKDDVFMVGSNPCISFNNKDYQVFEITLEQSGYYSLDIFYGAINTSYRPKTAVLVYDGTDYVEIARAEINSTGSYDTLSYQNIGYCAFLAGTYKIKVYQPYADIYFSSFSMTKTKEHPTVADSIKEDSYDKKGDKVYTTGGNPYISFNGGDYQSFMFVVPESGLYRFGVFLGANDPDYRPVTAVYIHDGNDYVEAGKKIVDATGGYSTIKSQTVGYYELGAGINKIKIYQHYADIFLSGISLSKTDDGYAKITKKAGDYTDITTKVNADGTLKFSHSYWASYTFDIEKAGQYMLFANAGTVQNNNVLSVFLNDIELCSKKFIKGFNNVLTEYYIGNFNLPEGEVVLKLKNTGVMYETFNVSSLSLIRIGDRCSSVISDETLLTTDDAYNKSTENDELSSGDSLEFDVDFIEGGLYKVTSEFDADRASFGVSTDGKNIGILDKDKKNVFFFLADKGECKLKIQVLSGSLVFNSLRFEKIDADNEKCVEFLNEINAAKTAIETEKTVEKYKEYFITDFSDVTDGMISLLPVYVKMYADKFDNVSEIVSAFYRYVAEEKVMPAVTMYNGSEQIKALKSGNITIEISENIFGDNATVAAAIYEEGRLYRVGVSSYSGVEKKIIIPLNEVVIDETKQYRLELIYLESLNTVKPYEKFDEVYREFFVSPDGSDENNGNEDFPFATLEKALDCTAEISSEMTGDIYINLSEGDYYIENAIDIKPIHSGQNGHNVIIRGVGETKPVINGGTKIKGWTEYKDGIFKAQYEPSKDVRNLYINGVPAIRAKSEYAFRCLEIYQEEEVNKGIIIKDTHFPDNFSNPGKLELVWELVWETQRTPVKSISYNGGDATIILDEDIMSKNSYTSTTGFGADKLFYIENALELLDKPGEFYYDADEGYIYYYPTENEDLTRADIYVGKSQGLINISGDSLEEKVHNISFENVSFKYGAWEEVTENGFLGRQSECVHDIENGSGYYIIPAQFTAVYADSISVRDCEFSCLGSSAVAYRDGVSNSELIGNIITDVSGTAISIGSFDHEKNTALSCENIQIKNNLIRRAAIEYRSCAGISFYYDAGVEICQNTISDLPYTAISGGWGWGALPTGRAGSNVICHNHIENVMCTLSDGGGIYILGEQRNTVIKENYINKVNRRSAALYSDNGSAFLHFNKNLCVDAVRFATASPGGHTNYYVGNFSVTDFIYEEYEKSTGYSKENFLVINENMIIDPDNLEGEPLNIKNNAGLSSDYMGNVFKTELPEGKNCIINLTPKKTYTNGVIYEAEFNYTPIGSNVKNYVSYLGMSATEGVIYEVDIEKAGVYEFGVYTASPNSKIPEISVYVNDVKQNSGALKRTATWTSFVNNDIGEITLPAGKVKLTIKVTNGSLHLDCFTLNYKG